MFIGVSLAYLVTALIAEWSFLPLADDVIYDARRMQSSLINKVDELQDARGLQQLDLRMAFFGLQALGPGGETQQHTFNQLPLVLIRGLSEVLSERVAYNLLLLAAWLLAALTLFGFSRELGASTSGAFIGGLILLLSPTLRSSLRCDSLDHAMIFWLPLIGLTLRRAARTGRGRDLAAAGIVLGGVAASNYYYLLAGFLLGAALLASALISATRDRAGEVRRILLATILGLTIAAPQLVCEFFNLEGGGRHPAGLGYVAQDMFNSEWLREMIGRYSLWLPFLCGLGLMGVVLSLLDPNRVLRWILAGLTLLSIALCLLLTLAHDLLADVVNALPMLWRLQRIDALWVLPLVMGAALAAVGVSELSKRMGSRGSVVGFVGILAVTLFLGLWTARGMDAQERSSPLLRVSSSLVERVQLESPATPFLVLSAPVGMHWDRILEQELLYLTGRRPLVLPRGPGEPDVSVEGLATIHERCPLLLIWRPERSDPPTWGDRFDELNRALGLKSVERFGDWRTARPARCLQRN